MAVGTGAGAAGGELSSWVWAKDGAAKATAAKAAMLAINRRIFDLSRAAGGGDGCGLVMVGKILWDLCYLCQFPNGLQEVKLKALAPPCRPF